MHNDPLVGRTLGQYRIVKKIGEGGMGAVYRAVHTTLEQERAFKILPRRLLDENPEYGKRFLREAKAAAGIDHENVVRVYDAGEIEGYHFIAQEFVKGVTVSDLVAARGPMAHFDALDIIIQAAQGLAAAEEIGIIHRDIKPANLMVTLKGKVKVADFGLAKNLSSGTNITMSGQVMGTPAYMSPEQADGMPTDSRTDIYSLGVTLFELVTGARPYNAPTPLGMLRQHCDAAVPDPAAHSPGIDPRLSAVIRRMMSKSPRDRFANHAELAAELKAIRANLAPGGRAPGLPTLENPDSLIVIVESTFKTIAEAIPETRRPELAGPGSEPPVAPGPAPEETPTKPPQRDAQWPRTSGAAASEASPRPARSFTVTLAIGIPIAALIAVALVAAIVFSGILTPEPGNGGKNRQEPEPSDADATGKLLADALSAEQAGDFGRAIGLLESAGKSRNIPGLEARIADLKKRKTESEITATPRSTMKELNSALANRDPKAFKNLCTAAFWDKEEDSAQEFFREAAGEGFIFAPTMEDADRDRAVLGCDLIIGGKKVDFVWALFTHDPKSGWLISGITEERRERDAFIGRESFGDDRRKGLPPEEPSAPDPQSYFDEAVAAEEAGDLGRAIALFELAYKSGAYKSLDHRIAALKDRKRLRDLRTAPRSTLKEMNSAIANRDEAAFRAMCQPWFWSQKGDSGADFYGQASRKGFVLSPRTERTEGDKAVLECDLLVGGKSADMVYVFFVEARPDGWFACGITENNDKASEYLHGGANKPPVKGR